MAKKEEERYLLCTREKKCKYYILFFSIKQLTFYMNRSAIHVSRIKNQHQAITLPQWNFGGSSQHLLDNSDNMSVISFSNRSTNNLLFDTEFNNSTNRLSVLASSKSRKSNNTE